MTISCSELVVKMREEPGLILVDAMTPEQYERSHLPGALNIPFSVAADVAEKMLPVKEAHIVVYCSNEACWMSSEIAALLKSRGYSYIWELNGGKKEWVPAGLPINGTSPLARKRSQQCYP